MSPALTLAHLQPYLAAAITVETPQGRGTLQGLSHYAGVARAGVWLLAQQCVIEFLVSEVKPVLRPFLHLVECLSGEIPLVGMAKVTVYGGWEPGVPFLHQEFGITWAMLPHATGPQFFNVADYFLAEGSIRDDVARYLRALHFAVGLADSQFIPLSL